MTTGTPTRIPTGIPKRWLAAIAGGVVAGTLAIGAVALLGSDGTSSTSAAVPPDQPGTGQVPRTITVSGEGSIKVKPDTASINLGVSATAPTASEALAQTNSKAAALIAAIKSAGVADDDIVTSGLSVYPQYSNTNVINGYQASNNVTVTVRKLDGAGKVIDAAAAAAGDNVTMSGISFYVDDTEALIGAARTAAIDNAKKRAGEFAKAAGTIAGAVLQISEVAVNVPPPMYYGREAAMDTAAGGVPIQSGTQDLTVNVTVVYALG